MYFMFLLIYKNMFLCFLFYVAYVFERKKHL